MVIFLLARTQFHIQSWQTYQRIVVMRKQEEDLWGKLSAVYGNSQLQQQTATKREMEMKKWQVWG